MNITFIRHGKTEGNLRQAYIGTTDESLSSLGKNELLTLYTPDFLVKKVYTSSKIRTIETAKLLFPSAVLCSDSNLSEMNFGLFEGKDFSTLQFDANYKKWVNSGCESCCPQGESKTSFTRRVNTAFTRILEDESGSSHLLFVVHGGTIMSICSQFSTPTDYFYWHVPCGHQLHFRWDGQCLEELL